MYASSMLADVIKIALQIDAADREYHLYSP